MFGKGDQVVCIKTIDRCDWDGSWLIGPYPGPVPTKGQVYTVAGTFCRPRTSHVYLVLEEFGTQISWCHTYFRKVQKKKFSYDFKKLLPTPIKELEDA